jgi:hypothetical protein
MKINLNEKMFAIVIQYIMGCTVTQNIVRLQ